MTDDWEKEDEAIGADVLPKSVAVRKKSGHVLLTKRDVDLMLGLHDHVVLSFVQIHEMFFTSRTTATAMNRLKRLESQGWIVRLRVSRLRLHGRKNAMGVVFQLSNRGRAVLAQAQPNVMIFDKMPLLNIYQLDHDLLIADIAEHFKRRFPEYQWTNGRYLKDIHELKKIPDAILRNPTSDRVIAIELELNGKSSQRYKEIVTNLKTSRLIERVIFVTAHTSIGRKIMSAIEGYAVPFGHRFRSEFFEFVRLVDCLKTEKSAS